MFSSLWVDLVSITTVLCRTNPAFVLTVAGLAPMTPSRTTKMDGWLDLSPRGGDFMKYKIISFKVQIKISMHGFLIGW